MSNPDSGIKKYFDLTAERFDGIYRADKPRGQWLLDALFRKTVNQRYDLIMADLRDMSGKTVLDVGTGSGRYAVELAARGATVTGVDFAGEMLRLARAAAKERGVEARCSWIEGEITDLPGAHARFDVSLAIGFFDYVRDPSAILAAMRKLTRGTLYLSFPKRWTLRTLPRKVRLRLNGCYVRFYTEAEVRELMRAAGFDPGQVQVISVNRDLIVKARST